MGDISVEEREKEAATKIKEAEAKKATAEAEKAETEAAQAKLQALTPSGEAKPVAGEVKTDDKAGYIATFAAYNAMIQKADEIAKKINSLSLVKARIMILDSLDFCNSDVQLLQISSQIDLVEVEFKEQVKRIDSAKERLEDMLARPAAPKDFAPTAPTIVSVASAALPFVKGAISSIADIIGFFKVDYDVKGQAITLSNTALHSLVAGRLDSQNCSAYLPNFHRIQSSDIIKKFENCRFDKDLLKSKTDDLKKLLKDAKVEEKKKSGTTEEQQIISAAEKAGENTETLLNEFTEFYKALLTVPKDGTYSPLAIAAIRQYLDSIGITHLLYLAVASSGGEMVTGKGLFQWGRVGFLGGCVVTYILAKSSGEIVSANTNFGYSGVRYNLGKNKLTSFINPI